MEWSLKLKNYHKLECVLLFIDVMNVVLTELSVSGVNKKWPGENLSDP